jgi:CubicO group peptidase (beta-lactamase class C family)
MLSPFSVEAMTIDQLTPGQKAASDFVPGFWERHGWGFGGSVITGRDDLSRGVGRYGWDGGLGTSWYSDPKEGLVGILMTQAAWTSPIPPAIRADFWKQVYRAIGE